MHRCKNTHACVVSTTVSQALIVAKLSENIEESKSAS